MAHNVITQFLVEKAAFHHGRVYALAGGAWLILQNKELEDSYRTKVLTLKTGSVLFRDYWNVACYDDGCPLSEKLHGREPAQVAPVDQPAAKLTRREMQSRIRKVLSIPSSGRASSGELADTICDALLIDAPHKPPSTDVRLWSEQSPEPVPSHGGPAVSTTWYLSVEGVTIATENDRRRWPTDPKVRDDLKKIINAPLQMVALFEQLSAAIAKKDEAHA